MWLMFTKALQEHSTAAQPTVINSACNFLFSVSLNLEENCTTLIGAATCKFIIYINENALIHTLHCIH